MQYQYISFGDTLAFAESLGWIDNGNGNESPNEVDELECDALEFIESKGYIIEY